MRTMTEPRNALLKQYEVLLAQHGARLAMSEGAQRGVAAEARRRGTGARGLRTLLEGLLLDARFAAPRHSACVVLLDASGAPSGCFRRIPECSGALKVHLFIALPAAIHYGLVVDHDWRGR